MPVRNAPSVLPTTLRLMADRLGRRWRGEGARGIPDFRARVTAVVGALGEAAPTLQCVALTPGGDWFDTGLDLAPGASVSVLADGMVWLARALDVGFGPAVGLWYRVGDAPLRKLSAASALIDSGDGGRLRFTTKPPGEFASPRGDFENALSRAPLKGGYTIAVLSWPAPAGETLARAADLDAPLFSPLHEQLARPSHPPAGWHYLWRLGEGRIFVPDDAKAGRVCCHTHADVGILQFPVTHELSEESRLDWRWCVEQLPSRLPEHTAPTHDYLSIAVEFENGLDLTYMWSVSLPEGTIFQCPLPWWDQRETHWVVRSGHRQLGEWLNESRPLLADYRRAIGGPDPSRVVAVWLIANTAFQRGHGRCQYEGIALSTGDRRDSIA